MKKNFFSFLNFSRIFSFILFLIFTSFLIFLFYKENYFYAGSKISNSKIYYSMGYLGLIFSFIIFFLPVSLSKKIFLVFSSILISVYILEYSLNYINLKDSLRITLAKKNNITYDKRTIFKVVRDLKKENNNVKIGFPTVGYIPPEGIKIINKNIYPLGGISNSLTVLCNETGKWSTYYSDMYGFNNTNEVWKNKIDILLIGDSYVHGDCVSSKNNISGQLKIKSQKNILNLGFRGNSPYLQLATFKEYGIQTLPKNIFWFFSEENDLQEILRDKNKNIITNYLDQNYTQNLKNLQSEIDEGLNEIHNKVLFYRNIKLQNIRLNIINRFFSLFNDKTEKTEKYTHKVNKKAEDIYFKIFKHVKKITEKNKLNLHIVYLPGYSRYLGNDYSALINSIKNISNSLNINFIDINKDVFMVSDNPLNYFPFQINSHYTEDAYSKISEVLLSNLKY